MELTLKLKVDGYQIAEIFLILDFLKVWKHLYMYINFDLHRFLVYNRKTFNNRPLKITKTGTWDVLQYF